MSLWNIIITGNVKLIASRKEGNVLFKDALNTFYLRLYGVRHMVKDHSDRETGNALPPHRLYFPSSSKGSFTTPTTTTTTTTTTTYFLLVNYYVNDRITIYYLLHVNKKKPT